MTAYYAVAAFFAFFVGVIGWQFKLFLGRREDEARARELELLKANEHLRREADIFREPRGDKQSVIDKL